MATNIATSTTTPEQEQAQLRDLISRLSKKPQGSPVFSTSTLAMVAKVLGQKYNINVTLGRFKTASTDGKTIYIPAVEGEWATDLARGYIDHESAHIRLTDFEIMPTKDFRGRLLNILEDIRIEKAIGKDYPGCASNLRTLSAVLEEKYGVFQPNPENPSSSILAWISAQGRVDTLAHDSVLESAQSAEPVARAIFGNHFAEAQRLLSTVKDLPEDTTGTKAVADLRAQFMALLAAAQEDLKNQTPSEPEPEPQPEPQEEEPEQEQNNTDKPEPGDSEPEEGECTEGGTEPEEGEGTEGGTEPEEGEGAEDGTEPEEGEDTEGGTDSEEGEDTEGGTDSEEGKGTEGGTEPEEGKGTEGGTEPEEGKGTAGGTDSEEGEGTEGGTDSEDGTTNGKGGNEGDTEGDDSGENQGANSASGAGTGPGLAPHQVAVVEAILEEALGDGNVEFGDIGELLQELLGQATRTVIDGDSIPLSPKLIPHWETEAPPFPDLASLRSHTANLRTKVTGLIQATKLQRSLPSRSGRKLDNRVLSRIRVGDDRIYSRKDEKKAVNTAIFHLLDGSTSMDNQCPGDKMYVASRACYMALEAFYAVPGVTSAAAEFNDMDNEVFELCRWGQKPRSEAFNHSSCGGTRLSTALWAAWCELMMRPEPRKILMIWSDGDTEYSDANPTLKAIARLKADGIEPIGIGIQDRHLLQYLPETKIIYNLDQLTPAVLHLLKEKLVAA